MKIKVFFAAIAFLAVASAFTTRKFNDLNYRYLGDGGSKGWRVENVARTSGTGSGQYNCNNTGNCVVTADDQIAVPQLNADGFYYLPKSQSSIIPGAYTQF